MPKTLAIVLAVLALGVAAVVGYLSFGRTSPPASTFVPASPDAVATPDGAEVNP